MLQTILIWHELYCIYNHNGPFYSNSHLCLPFLTWIIIYMHLTVRIHVYVRLHHPTSCRSLFWSIGQCRNIPPTLHDSMFVILWSCFIVVSKKDYLIFCSNRKWSLIFPNMNSKLIKQQFQIIRKWRGLVKIIVIPKNIVLILRKVLLLLHTNCALYYNSNGKERLRAIFKRYISKKV